MKMPSVDESRAQFSSTEKKMPNVVANTQTCLTPVMQGNGPSTKQTVPVHVF
ncbi:hypothetical protein DPMN_054040 [Dreissena polymorpha]|uniref:Uncharacterized protein n=1 Tax=Dreissena polymorpha TaxID=45954 RepID=A0A9D4CPK5_DREPO|nr:hypothetical protein DPMN_054040 [Dreissena polymorpha]